MKTVGPEATNSKDHDITEYGERIGRYSDLYNRKGHIDEKKLLASLGGSTQRQKAKEGLTVDGPRDFIVSLIALNSARRNRFTIAREIGHYFLQYKSQGLTDNRAYERGGNGRAEVEANLFAAGLLMPEKEFKSAWASLKGDSRQVARQFDVSPLAASTRAQFLGIIESDAKVEEKVAALTNA